MERSPSAEGSSQSGSSARGEFWGDDFLFGSLWWAEEKFWMDSIRGYQDSGRLQHPGCSVCRRPQRSLQAVPLLFGTSKKNKRAFEVRGLTRREPQRVSWFGVFTRPTEFPFYSNKSYISELEYLAFGEITREARPYEIQRNLDKPILNSEEMESAEGWCSKFYRNG